MDQNPDVPGPEKEGGRAERNPKLFGATMSGRMTTQRRSLGISDRADLNLDVYLSRLNKRLRKSLDHEVILNLATIAENDLFRSSKLMDSQEKMVRNP